MQLYVADYLGDTRHLTTEQHGAYLLLLMTMWRSGGRLPNDPKKLSRIVGCTPSRWTRIAGDVLVYFDLNDGDLTNKRLTVELEKASEKSIKRAVLGSLGGKAKALKTSKSDLAIATVLLKHSSEPELEPEERTPEERSSGVARTRASRLHVDWEPDEIDRAYASAKGLAPAAIAAMAERFRNHWTAKSGKDATKLDWAATWRNWVLGDLERKGSQSVRKAVGFV